MAFLLCGIVTNRRQETVALKRQAGILEIEAEVRHALPSQCDGGWDYGVQDTSADADPSPQTHLQSWDYSVQDTSADDEEIT